jgi:hypothetical protein
MGSVSDAYDNAMCESFFATLECELLDRTRFRTHADARMAVFEYIEGWYNPHRRHSALDYRSPVNYERSQLTLNRSRKPSTVHRTGGSPGVLAAMRSDELIRRANSTCTSSRGHGCPP